MNLVPETASGMEVSDDGLAVASAGLGAADSLEAVQEVVRHAARALARSHGSTLILRDGDQCFYADEDAISPLWKGQRFPLSRCISGWAILHQEKVVVPDIYADERVPVEAYRPTFVKSLAVVPIGAVPVGAIGVYWAVTHTATPSELDSLEQLSGLTATALERVTAAT